MPSSSFQTTIFDYMRVIFHRWHWILGMILLTVGAAWIWVNIMAPRLYRSEMVVMVWSQDPIDPGIKRMVKKEPLQRVMNRIRDKLQVDRRLQNLVCNLRFALKQERFERMHYADVDSKLQQELAKFTPARSFVVRPAGILGCMPGRLARALGWQRHTVVGLADLAGQMDMQALARILCDELEVPKDAALVDHVILDMMPWGGRKRSSRVAGPGTGSGRDDSGIQYVNALRHWYQKSTGTRDKINPALNVIRRAAVAEVSRRIQKEAAKPGAGNFSSQAKEELLKEIVSIGWLLDLKVYYAVRDLYADPDKALQYWINNLKSGLYVGSVHGNLLQFRCNLYLFRRHSPFDKAENVIADVVVRVAEAMMEREFYSTENRQFTTTNEAIVKSRDKIQKDLDAVNRKLYNLDKLTSIQLSFLEKYPQVERTDEKFPNRPFRPGWDDPFRGLPRESIHIARIDQFYGELRKIDKEIVSLEADIQALTRDIEDPDNQKRVIPRKEQVEKGDPAEVVALKRELALKLVKLKRLLENNTEKHPFVVKLKGEIDQIKSALHDYRIASRDTSAGGGVIEEANPLIAKWKEEKLIDERKLAGLRAERHMTLNLIREEKKKAEDAIRKQREYRSLLERQQRLTAKLHSAEARKEELEAKRAVGEDFQVLFTIHTKPRKVTAHIEPKDSLILLMALMVGMLSAGTTVFLLEYTDHSIKTTEDIKHHIGLPVLGTIPEFSFIEIEKSQRQVDKGRSFPGRSGFQFYPPTLEQKAPDPESQRAKLTSRKGLSTMTLVLLVIGIVIIMIAFFLPWGNIFDRLRARGAGSTTLSQESKTVNIDSDKKEKTFSGESKPAGRSGDAAKQKKETP